MLLFEMQRLSVEDGLLGVGACEGAWTVLSSHANRYPARVSWLMSVHGSPRTRTSHSCNLPICDV